MKDSCGPQKNPRVAAQKNFHCIIRAWVASVPCGAHSSPSFFLLVIYALCTFFTEAATPEERGREGGALLAYETSHLPPSLADLLLSSQMVLPGSGYLVPLFTQNKLSPWHQVRKRWQGAALPFCLYHFRLPSGRLQLHLITGVDFMLRSGFREYEEEKLRSAACCRQEYATFSPHIHGILSVP